MQIFFEEANKILSLNRTSVGLKRELILIVHDGPSWASIEPAWD